MHHHFMPHSSGRLFELLKRTYLQYINQEIGRVIKNIWDACELCNEHYIPQFKFTATLGEENRFFDRENAMDIMCLNGKLS